MGMGTGFFFIGALRQIQSDDRRPVHPSPHDDNWLDDVLQIDRRFYDNSDVLLC